ncbi:uncharacterized protein LOC111027540 [Myzus persicae]|uniref:uncharacterized protein LOC111027540 n=1 Tax=Myzus persicae TaxID=13164 RepID=UPI000B930BA7|nr:uncharacterized protein LOC111027540 [Myzus persicae]
MNKQFFIIVMYVHCLFKGIQYFQQRRKNQPNITYFFKKNLCRNTIWCYLYGPLYLLRFLAHLPFILMSNSSLLECDLNTFVLHIEGLYRFLENNYDTYFTDNSYMDVEYNV